MNTLTLITSILGGALIGHLVVVGILWWAEKTSVEVATIMGLLVMVWTVVVIGALL